MQQTQRQGIVRDILRRLGKAPVVAVLGARQVGKTTLSRQVAEEWQGAVTRFDLELPTDREALTNGAQMVLERCEGLVILDEVQRLPSLFELLRPLCDRPGRTTRFLLLGSASWELVKGVSESLAGRIQFVDVSGFSLAETGGESLHRLWFRGGFPPAFCAETDADAMEWHEAFRRTFLERDIPVLGIQVAPDALRRFWTMLAHYHGQVWNASRLAVAMDCKRSTVERYRDVLSGTFMVRVLPPWFENLGKRLVKSPKVYLRDSGVLHGLLGLGDPLELSRHPTYGASWEGFALEQTLIVHGGRDAYFYATQRGAELDLLLMRRGRRWGFEFKCTDAPTTTKSMHIALDDLKLEHLWVVYPGNLRYPMTDSITALPLREIGMLELKATREEQTAKAE
jgi:predicted AAA+ superfamily ATPase